MGTRPYTIHVTTVLIEFQAHILSTEWHLYFSSLNKMEGERGGGREGGRGNIGMMEGDIYNYSMADQNY